MKISIITPSYNSGKYLDRAIQSVMNQDYRNWEHIIVDGGSKDETVEVLTKYPHLKWISEPDKGQSDAMNKGFGMSCGDIIVYLNADDWFEPLAFSRVIDGFVNNNTDMVFGDLIVQFVPEGRTEIRTPSIEYHTILQYWKNKFPANPVSYFYKRKVQKGYQFPVTNQMTMDMDFIFYASKYFSISYVPHALGVFLVYGTNKTAVMDIGKEQRVVYLHNSGHYEPWLFVKFYLSKIKQRLIR